MLGYRYALGDIVCFQGRARGLQPAAESFEITALLPMRDGVAQYRVRSKDERYERVVMEDDIERARGTAANTNLPADER